LVEMVVRDEINQTTAKTVLAEMYASGLAAETIVAQRGLGQVSDVGAVQGWVKQALAENPDQVKTYLAGKPTISRWLFGQVMRLAHGQANPQIVQQELERQLQALRAEKDCG